MMQNKLPCIISFNKHLPDMDSNRLTTYKDMSKDYVQKVSSLYI